MNCMLIRNLLGDIVLNTKRHDVLRSHLALDVLDRRADHAALVTPIDGGRQPLVVIVNRHRERLLRVSLADHTASVLSDDEPSVAALSLDSTNVYWLRISASGTTSVCSLSK